MSPRMAPAVANTAASVAKHLRKELESLKAQPGPTANRAYAQAYLTADLLEYADVLVSVLEAASGLTACNVVHGDRPKDWTCYDSMIEARAGQGRLTPEFRARMSRGEDLCGGCTLRAAMDSLR